MAEKIEMYSPNQILGGSILGGPVASILMLRRNFINLGNPIAARKTLIWGIVALVVILALVYVIHKISPQFPRSVIPVLYSVSAMSIAGSTQLDKTSIDNSDVYKFRSNWNVVLLGVISLIGSLIVSFVPLFVAEMLLVLIGIVHK